MVVLWCTYEQSLIDALTVLFQDAKNLAACDMADLGDTMRVTQNDANL